MKDAYACLKEYPCPDANITCYHHDKSHPEDCHHFTKIKTHKSKDSLLSCKITKEEGKKVCKNDKYWICNLDQLL
jgi:hypothetical protein